MQKMGIRATNKSSKVNIEVCDSEVISFNESIASDLVDETVIVQETIE